MRRAWLTFEPGKLPQPFSPPKFVPRPCRNPKGVAEDADDPGQSPSHLFFPSQKKKKRKKKKKYLFGAKRNPEVIEALNNLNALEEGKRVDVCHFCCASAVVGGER